MHKLFKAGRVERDPTIKARAFVTEVIVMDGPACLIPSMNLSLTERCCGVWSTVFTMTNMSSTPIPKIMKGTIEWNPDTSQPSSNDKP